MKKTMFKIAGVKNDKEFYAKYPTEESFMAKHGKAFKKAQAGLVAQQQNPNVNFNQANGQDISGPSSPAGASGFMDNMGGIGGITQAAGSIINGISAIKGQKEKLREAKQMAAVSGVAADAAESIDVDAHNQMRRVQQQRYDAQMRPVNGEELFPINGVGTNVLAQNGVSMGSGRRMTPGRKKVLDEKAKAQATKDSLFDAKIKAISKEPGFKAYMKNKKAQMGGEYEAPLQQLDEMQLYGDRAIHLPNKQGDEQVEALRSLQARKKLSDEQMGGFQDQRVSDRDWEARKQQYFQTEFSNWRSGKTGHSPNNKFNQGSPEYMGAWESIKEKWHNENPRQINPIVQSYAEETKRIKAANGFSNFMNSDDGKQVGAFASSTAGNLMGNDAGSQIGGGVGKLAGTAIGGPMGGIIGEVGGKLIGGAIDRNAEKVEGQQNIFNKNIDRMNWANQDPTSAYTKYGGQFQNGGTLMEGSGDVQMGPEGNLTPISINPYTAGGETNMIQGPSHAEGGTRLNYGGNNIEAEREPIMKMQQGGDAENLVIFGDLPINKQTAEMIGDPEAKGRKFKKYVEKIADKETKANQKMTRAQKVASDLKPINKFDRLKLGTQEIIQKGSDTKLKMYAEQKENAAMAQNAINQTAEELGADPKMVAQGGEKFEKWMNSKLAKNKKLFGEPKIAYAQEGITITSDKKQEYLDKGWKIDPKNPSRLYKDGTDPITVKGAAGVEGGTETKVIQEAIAPIKDNYKGPLMDNDKWTKWYNSPAADDYKKRYVTGTPAVTQEIETQGLKGFDSFELPGAPPQEMFIKDPKTGETVPVKDKKGFDYMPWLSAIAPYIPRPSDAEGLQGNQLLGEMFALSNNKLEPVQAQSYRPDLDVPFDISLQDRLNRNTSGIRAASRMAQGNPAAQAMLQAQGYAQDQPILGEQFRANQTKKDQVYSGNRATLNDARLKNLQIYDTQYTRQEQAKSNTKEATQLALNSISDKYQKNKLEQRTLKTYENMYKYRFGNDYRAQNMNDPADFKAMWEAAQIAGNDGTGIPPGTVPVYNNKGKITGYKVIDNSSNQPSISTPGYNPDAQYNTKFGGTITRTLKKF